MNVYIRTETGHIFCEGCVNEYAPELSGKLVDTQFGGEVDAPQHCALCETYLDFPLTGDGIQYVLVRLAAAVTLVAIERADPGQVYIDHDAFDTMAEWADDLRWYGLDDNAEEVVQKFRDYYGELVDQRGDNDNAELSTTEHHNLVNVRQQVVYEEFLVADDRSMARLNFAKWLVEQGRINEFRPE